MDSRYFIAQMRFCLIPMLAVGLPLAGCNGKQPDRSQCLVMARMFCVGTSVSSFNVTVEENAKSIENSIAVVRGESRTNPKSRFVALVRNKDAPSTNADDDRNRLCKALSIDPVDCTSGPLKTAEFQYEELYDGHKGAVVKGIRVELLVAEGILSSIVDSLAIPCAGLEDGTRGCGPHLGVCVRRRNSIGCDFRDNFWTALWKWKWSHTEP